jgi:glycosyltransferase involved in cell wall biosynthesis
MEPLVSILIPAYNVEKFLVETLESAINQSYKNLEIIVLDDGSSDNTFKIAKMYESNNVKVVTQENTGACRARNNLLSHAQGDFIQWLDSDDILDKDKIYLQMKILQSVDPSNTFLTSSFGTFFHNINRAKFERNSLWQDLTPIDWMLNKFNDNVWMNPTAWLVSRSLTKKGGVWEEKIARSGDDDGEYVCRIIKNATSVKFVGKSKCYYRIGNFGSLNWNSKAALDELYLSLRLTTEHLLALEESDRTKKASVKFLQYWISYFDEEESSARLKMVNYAQELGGELIMPHMKLKYFPFKLILGEKFARKMKNYLPQLKVRMYKKWDQISLNLSKNRS